MKSYLTGMWIDRDVTEADVNACFMKASQMRPVSVAERARLLRTIAQSIMDLGETLLMTCHEETALPMARLTGERGRTCNQLRMFADLVESDVLDPVHDPGDRERQPLPKPDLVLKRLPLGPVGVFGASNFPLAFSVAGGDTASALAAGCPVVVKGHPAHPRTCEQVGEAISAAISACGLPPDCFSLLQGGVEVGQWMVQDPNCSAIGFTGSFAGGKALFDAANKRPRPIPVFAEMGSTNPSFLMPEALSNRSDTLARDFASSVSMGVGQFCTNPGLIFGVKGADFDRFAQELVLALGTYQGEMLTEGICAAYGRGVERLSQLGTPLMGLTQPEGRAAKAAVFKVSLAEFVAREGLREEVFGPATLLVECPSVEDFPAAITVLDGQLTGTVHFDPGESTAAGSVGRALSEKVGRLIANGFPTGVEVSKAMNHGGPFPATTDARYTSVGTEAIWRWLRPICLQDCPADWL